MSKKDYDEIITQLTDKFEERVSNDEADKDKLVKAFKDRLYTTVKNLENSKESFVDKSKDSIMDVVAITAYDLITSDINYVKQQILIDENLEKIRQVSGQAFQMAQDVVNGEKIKLDFDVEEKVKELDSLAQKVEEYNVKLAKTMVSETILDLRLIENPKSNITSLRIAHMKNSNQNIKEDKEEER